MSSSELAGAITVTGGANVTFTFASPPGCVADGPNGLPTTSLAQAVQVGFRLIAGHASVALLMRNYHGVGDYEVDPYGNGNYVLYDPTETAGDSWPSANGSIHVTRSDSGLVEGTVDANVQTPYQVASGTRIMAYVTGKWACLPPS